MSLQLKLALPLIDEGLKTKHLSEKTGFINAFSWNKNKPYIDNCIFLMYSNDIHNEYTVLRDMDLLSMESFYGKDYITSGGKNYVIYMFTITNNDAKNRILKGLRHLDGKSWQRICKFWNHTDDLVNKYLAGVPITFACADSGVPEADYFLTDEDLDKKAQRV